MAVKPWGSEFDPKPDVKKSFVSWDVYETRHTDANLTFKAAFLDKCGLGPMAPLIETLVRYSLENCFCPYDMKLLNRTDFKLQICMYNEKGFQQLCRFWFLVSEQLPYQVTMSYEPHHVDIYFILLPPGLTPIDKQLSYPVVCSRISKILKEFSKH